MAPVELLQSRPEDVEDWVSEVDDVSAKIKGIIDGSITDFEKFDQEMELKQRAKAIREEEAKERRERFYRMGVEGKGEGKNYKWWCRRCFVEYSIDLPGNCCSRCSQSDKMMTQEQRREELLGKVEDMKQEKVRHQWRKDKWLRWKKSQALLRRSRNINYKAWEYWEPDTDSEDEGEPIVPRENPEFLAMEADLISRRKKTADKAQAAKKCQEQGNSCMKEGDFIGAIEHYEEGLENNRSNKALWTNKALAEIKVFRYHDAVESCNKVIEYAEIFEEGFSKSADACFKAFMRRTVALSALHKWEEALQDVEDALRLFPRDQEAKALHKKTAAAVAEAKEASEILRKQGDEGLEAAKDAKGEDLQQEEEEQAATEGTKTQPQFENDEELSEDDAGDLEKEAVADQLSTRTSHSQSLARLSAREFSALTRKLRENHSARVEFCAQSDANEGVIKREDALSSRKVCLKKVEEVVEPSGLEGVLKDMERCCILWKKAKGKVVPLREDVKLLEGSKKQPREGSSLADVEAQEEADDLAFVKLVTPRALEVLCTLARASDLHCEFTSSAIRHVWPFLADPDYSYVVLDLLSEWSQRRLSAKALVEFAARYPEPHLNQLVKFVSEETKENMLPPNLEAKAEKAHKRMSEGKLSLEKALSQVVDSFATASATELAVSTLGNICLAGTSSKAFKEHLGTFCKDIIDAFRRYLKPQHARLCSRTAGALCNLVRLGETFATKAQEECLEILVTAVREESTSKSQSKALMQELGDMLQEAGCMAPLLGALINLLSVRPAACAEAVKHGLMDLVVPLASEEACSASTTDKAVISTRALLLIGRLLGAVPSALSISLERQLLHSLQRILGACLASSLNLAGGADTDADELTVLDATIRILTVMITKTQGALARMTDSHPRIEEVVEGTDLVASSSRSTCSRHQFEDLVETLMRIARRAQPKEHVSPEDEGNLLSKVRGNLALLFANLSEAQARDGASPPLRELDLSGMVEVFLECLRKERGGARHNAGVCVSRLAQQQRYRQIVRDLNGIESLHQIQMPQVEKQKEEAMKQHRKKFIPGAE